MKNDTYVRGVLTVIAAALLYLCAVLTPLPAVSAQAGRVVGAATPGVSTGPAEMVVVGWKVPDTVPVTITRGEVHVTNESLRVNGTVRAESADAARMIVVGWEDGGSQKTPGRFTAFDDASGRHLPVSLRGPR